MGGLLSKVVRYFKIPHALLLIPICGFAIYDSVFSSFSSILAVLRDTYPEAPVTLVQTILTLPSLASVPGTLFSGFLAAYVHKKYIAVFACSVIFIGGMMPVVFPDPPIYAMLVCSACIGLGQGLLHPLANAIICQAWPKDGERSRVLGFKQSFNYIGAAIVSLCVGTLAITYWGNAFLVYLGVIPVLVLAAWRLPKGELDKRLVSKKEHAAGLKEILKPRSVYLFALFFFAAICMFGWHTNIAMLIQDSGLGSTEESARITSTISMCSLVVALSYGVITKYCGRYTLAIGFALLGSGLVIASTAASMPVVTIGAVLFGLGTGVQEISTVFYVSKIVDKRIVTMALSITVSCVALGVSTSPVALHWIEGIIFNGTGAAGAMLIAGIGYFALVVIEGIVSKVRKADEMNEDDLGDALLD